YEFTKGTVLQHNNVVIAEGPLPHSAQVRAVEHERERCRAIVLRQRENPVAYSKTCLDTTGKLLPQVPADGSVPLPSLLEEAPRPPEPPLGTIPGTVAAPRTGN